MFKKLAVAAICLAFAVWKRPGAGCQDRDRQCAKGAGRSEIDHVFGIGEGCGVPAVRGQLHRHELPRDARSDAADQQLRPRDRPHGPGVARTRDATNNIGAGGSTARDAWNVFPAGDAAAGGCLAALGRFAGVLHHAVGFSERRGREQRHSEPQWTARATPSSPGARR